MVSSKCAGSTLYVTPGSGNSFKPALALAQLSTNHQMKFVNVLAGETRSREYLAVNELGQVPFLVDADGFGVGQSNAMLWYIADGSLLIPTDGRSRAAMLQWMFFEQTRLEPNISPARFYTFVVPARRNEFSQDIPVWQRKASEALSVLDRHLGKSDFIVTEHGYSIGDIAVFGYVHMARQAGLDLDAFPAIVHWIERVSNMDRYVPIEILLRPPA